MAFSAAPVGKCDFIKINQSMLSIYLSWLCSSWFLGEKMGGRAKPAVTDAGLY
jgi:hypothetical protein